MAKFSYLRALPGLVGVAAVLGALLLAMPASAHAPGPNFTQAVDLGTTTEWGTGGVTSEPTNIPDGDGWLANYFKVRVVARGGLVVWTSGGFSPSLQIYDQSEMPIGSQGTSRRVATVDAGIYYVRAGSRSKGRYRLHVAGGGIGHDDIGNNSPQAAPLPSCRGLEDLTKCKPSPQTAVDSWDAREAHTLTARIDYHNDLDWYKFDVPEGPRVRVRIWSSGGTDTYAFLWDGDDFLLEQNNGGGSGGNFHIERDLGPGTYTLLVEAYRHANVGPYRLHLAGRDDHGNFLETASRVMLPSVTAASLEYSADRDQFWFRVTTPGSVRIRTTGNARTYGVLYDSFEVEMAGTPLYGGSEVNTTLQEGTYYLVVRCHRNFAGCWQTGPYDLHLSGDASGVLTVPLVPADGNARGQQGFVRVINRSDQPAEVGITAVDDTGMRRELSSPLQLAAWQTLHFNSRDLERGNANKGMASGIGSGMGNWYLEVAPTRPEVEALSYIRTEDGFLTSMHTQPPIYGRTHRVVTFNPGSNTNQASRLRLINLRCPQADISGCEAANVTIYGVDDAGKRSPDVRLSVPPGAVREVTAAELEGLAQNAEGLEGSLGDGAGKWQLFVSSDLPIQVISLLESVSGHLTNLSAPAAGQRFSAPPSE